MDLITYRKQAASAADPWGELADKVGSSKAYISQLAYGHRKASPEMARRIQVATAGAVRREDLRPDIFAPIDQQAA